MPVREAATKVKEIGAENATRRRASFSLTRMVRNRYVAFVLGSSLALAFAAQACGSNSDGEVAIDGDAGDQGDATTTPDGTTTDEGGGNADGGGGGDTGTNTDAGGNGDGGGPLDLPDGSVILPDGGILLPDGGVIGIPDGGVVLPDGGGILLPDGGIIPPDGGGIAVPDGGGTLPDGGTVVVGPDGGVVCVQTTCQGKIYQCGDCMDNDGDGKIDMHDVGCLGPCDNTETDLTLGIPGGNNAPCKADCYFDQDTGSGNDTCIWDHGCDPHEVPASFYPETQSGNKCAYNWSTTKVQGNGTCEEFYDKPGQPKTCHDFCSPLTPNGCDCFGCCTFPALANVTDSTQPPPVGGPQKPAYVWLGSLDSNGNPSCTIDKVTDPTKCHPCTPVKDCLNTCEHCELCIGKDTLPADCKPPVFVDGGVVQPDASILQPDGGVVPIPDGGVTLPDGAVELPDGGVVQPDGGTIPPPPDGGTGGTDGGTGGTDGGTGGSDAGTGGQCGGQICFVGQACGLACQPPCPTGEFCNTGCCTPNPK